MQHALLWYCRNIGDLRALLLAVGIYGAEFLFDAALFISRRRRCRIEGEEAYRSMLELCAILEMEHWIAERHSEKQKYFQRHGYRGLNMRKYLDRPLMAFAPARGGRVFPCFMLGRKQLQEEKSFVFSNQIRKSGNLDDAIQVFVDSGCRIFPMMLRRDAYVWEVKWEIEKRIDGHIRQLISLGKVLRDEVQLCEYGIQSGSSFYVRTDAGSLLGGTKRPSPRRPSNENQKEQQEQLNRNEHPSKKTKVPGGSGGLGGVKRSSSRLSPQTSGHGCLSLVGLRATGRAAGATEALHRRGHRLPSAETSMLTDMGIVIMHAWRWCHPARCGIEADVRQGRGSRATAGYR